MGNQVGVEAKPSNWLTKDHIEVTSARNYPRKYDHYLHGWVCSPDPADTDLVTCNPLNFLDLPKFSAEGAYIIIHTTYSKDEESPKGGTDSVPSGASAPLLPTEHYRAVGRSFSSLQNATVRDPLVSQEDHRFPSSSPSYEIHVWTGKEASVITQVRRPPIS